MTAKGGRHMAFKGCSISVVGPESERDQGVR